MSLGSVQTRVYVFDLDGVLYRGADAVDGAAETLDRLRAQRDPAAQLFFLTNNSSQTRGDYVEKLTKLGMPCTEDEVVTSASATADYLTLVLGKAGSRVLSVGGIGIKVECERAGLDVTHASELVPGEAIGDPFDPFLFDNESFDYVVVGIDRNLTYRTLHRAQQAILRGASFIATNRDGQYPIEGGRVTPGGGAMVAALVACTETEPLVIGKPETSGLATILKKANATPQEAVMIGDRLDTDILCGNRLGVPSVLVLTGVTTSEQAAAMMAARTDWIPTRIINDLRAL